MVFSAYQHQGVYPSLLQRLHHVQFSDRIIFMAAHQQLKPRCGQRGLHGVRAAGKNRMVQSRNDAAYCLGPPGGQRAPRSVRHITQFLHGALDQIQRLRPHPMGQRQSARHSGSRHPGELGDIFNANSLLHEWWRKILNICNRLQPGNHPM